MMQSHCQFNYSYMIKSIVQIQFLYVSILNPQDWITKRKISNKTCSKKLKTMIANFPFLSLFIFKFVTMCWIWNSIPMHNFSISILTKICLIAIQYICIIRIQYFYMICNMYITVCLCIIYLFIIIGQS